MANFTVTYKRLNPYSGWEAPTTAVVVATDPTNADLVARQTLGVGTFTDPEAVVAPYPEFIVKGVA